VHAGYLLVETHAQRPGLTRVAVSERLPATPGLREGAPRRIRYVARFSDADAALMHAHNLLRRYLLDADAGLYRTDLNRAIAAVESLGLSHHRVYLDPTLDDGSRADIEHHADRLAAMRRRRDRACYAIGYGALLLLIIRALMGLF
jgi:hypothetical protein